MATRSKPAPVAPVAQLCDYCHQKAKFSNHSYCSKTCATQAATLCNHCHKKPKFQNFEYCGKNCASLAGPAAKPAAPRPGQRGTNGPKQQQQQQQQPFQQPAAFDPVQIAKLMVQQIPQVQAMLNAANGSNPGSAPKGMGYQPPQTQNYYAPQVVPPTSNPAAPQNNPFLNAAAQQHQTNNALHLSGTGGPLGQRQYAAAADDLECLIPGCGKPVHVDAKGLKTSDYCSQRHREEAVTKGLVSPCIMCLTRPQSHTDYFCGRACREESLNKHYEVGAAAPVPQQASVEEVVEDEDDDDLNGGIQSGPVQAVNGVN